LRGCTRLGPLRPTALYHASVYLVDTCPYQVGQATGPTLGLVVPGCGTEARVLTVVGGFLCARTPYSSAAGTGGG
jgi:hypothetical protein